MKKYIISVACILTALVSCQKNDAKRFRLRRKIANKSDSHSHYRQ